MSIAAAPTSPKVKTAEDIFVLSFDGIDREIIRGEVKERPAVTMRNHHQSRTEARIARFLDTWLDDQPAPRGQIVSGEAGFRLSRDPETIVGIDVAYVSAEVVKSTPTKTAFFEGPPVLAVEIMSPSDTLEDILTKVSVYHEAGTVVWVVDPYFQSVAVHRPGQEVAIYSRSGELDGAEYLPGFRVSVAALFE